MTVKELKDRLNSVDGNSQIGFVKYGDICDIGEIIIVIAEDGTRTVKMYEATKKVTDLSD